MKKKYKFSDVTKFTIALGLCLSLILVSIVLVNVFTHEEKSAKAEAVSDDGYSFAVYDNAYDARFTNLSIATSFYEEHWGSSTVYSSFVYFARDGEPYNFPGSGNKSEVYVEFDIYNPSNCDIRSLQLASSATSWGSRFSGANILSSDSLIRRTLTFDNFNSTFGSLCFVSNTRVSYYVTYVHVHFYFDGSYYNIYFGSQDFYDLVHSEYERGYSDGLLSGYADGLSSGTSDAKYGIFNGATFTTTFIKEDQSTDVVTGIQPILNNSTLSWENVYDYWLENYFEIENIDNVLLKINFAQSFDFASNPIYVRVDSDVTDFVFNDMYNASWNYLASSITNADTLLTLDSNQNAPDTFQVNSLSIYFGRVSDTLAIGYINGTNDSYNQGRQVGFLEGYDEGVSVGNSERENDMYNLGYNRGFAAGSQGQFSFATLFTAAIEAPINAVLNGFNVEILGMNLRNFYLSLFSLAIVIVVIKLILFRRS